MKTEYLGFIIRREGNYLPFSVYDWDYEGEYFLQAFKTLGAAQHWIEGRIL